MSAPARPLLARPALLVAGATFALASAACGGAQSRDVDVLDGTGIVDLELLLDQTVVTDEDGDALVMIQIVAAEAPEDARAPVRVALVIDTSGSMEGNKMDNAISAAHDLIDRLDDNDELSLISYGDGGTLHLGAVSMRRARADAHEAVAELESRGNTCTSCGMQMAYDALLQGSRDGVHRVIVLTDGHANRGIVDEPGLRAMASNAHVNLGFDTTTIGLGRLHNELMLAAVAEAGAADYYFLHSSDYLSELLDMEIASLHSTAVRDLVLRLSPGDGVAFAATYNIGATATGQEIVFDIGHLAVGEKRKFIIELNLPAGDMGRAVFAEATFADVTGRPYIVESNARIDRSRDLARVEESIDARVIEEHALLASAIRVEEAMEYFANGQRDEGLGVLEANWQQLQEYSESGGDDVRAEIEQMDAMIDSFGVEYAPESAGPPGLATAAPAPAQPVMSADEERGSVILYRAQSNERRRGRERGQSYHQPAQFDLSEME